MGDIYAGFLCVCVVESLIHDRLRLRVREHFQLSDCVRCAVVRVYYLRTRTTCGANERVCALHRQEVPMLNKTPNASSNAFTLKVLAVAAPKV